ncbi:MAG TPA: biotin/lipoyl-containing protein, partial [Casimicrobiaceae bacterium]
MRVEVKVPQLPESIAEATLVNWHKQPGDPVKRDENLIDIETDKVVLELPAPNDGVLAEIKQPNGATVTSNDVIAVIDTAAKPAVAPAPAATQSTATTSTAPASAKPAASASTAPSASSPVTALPAARKM